MKRSGRRKPVCRVDQDSIESLAYERNRDRRQSAGNRVHRPVRLQENALATTDGGICSAKNVPGVRVDHATVEGSVHGVWEGVS